MLQNCVDHVLQSIGSVPKSDCPIMETSLACHHYIHGIILVAAHYCRHGWPHAGWWDGRTRRRGFRKHVSIPVHIHILLQHTSGHVFVVWRYVSAKQFVLRKRMSNTLEVHMYGYIYLLQFASMTNSVTRDRQEKNAKKVLLYT